MTHPSPGLLDPLADWPRVDPRRDYARAAIDDVAARAERWNEAGERVAAAHEALAAGRGAACETARIRTGELAVAIGGLAGPMRDVAGVLEGYLLAYDRYEEELAVARAVARESVREVLATRRAQGASETAVPLTPLRQQAWDLANAALETFADAGRYASVLVQAATAMITGSWVDTGTACQSTSLLGMLIGGGEAQSAVRGAGSAVRSGFQLLVLRRRGLLTGEDVQRVRKELSVGGTTLTPDDGRLRALAGAVATRAGVGEGAFAILGVASGLAQVSTLVAGDVVTVLDGGGEDGARGVVTRASAAANGIAGAQLAMEVFEKAGLRLLSSVAVPVFVATSVYQLGDLAYTHRKWIGATLGSFAGHRAAQELP
jgi:hypothetical protein